MLQKGAREEGQGKEGNMEGNTEGRVGMTK